MVVMKAEALEEMGGQEDRKDLWSAGVEETQEKCSEFGKDAKKNMTISQHTARWQDMPSKHGWKAIQMDVQWKKKEFQKRTTDDH